MHAKSSEHKDVVSGEFEGRSLQVEGWGDKLLCFNAARGDYVSLIRASRGYRGALQALSPSWSRALPKKHFPLHGK